MSPRPSLERSIAAWMADEAAFGDDDALFNDVLAATGRARPEARWLALLKEPPMRMHSRVAVGSPTARILLVALVPLLLLLVSFAVVLATQPSDATDDWPIYLGDYDRSGVAEQGPVGRPVVRWQFQAGGSMTHNIAIVGDLVYALSDDGLLHSLSRQDGTERWTYPATGSDVSVAVGLLTVADDDGAIHGLDALSGAERWAADPLPTPTGATYGDGRLYVGTGAGELVALDPATGAIAWRTAISDTSVHNPSFSDGRVFAGTAGAYVALDADDGRILWTVDLGPDDTGSARIGDGVAYIGKSGDAPSSRLRAIDAETGAELWNVEGRYGAPTIGDGVGYSGSEGRLTAFDLRAGTQRWNATFDGGLGGPVLADGKLYVLIDQKPTSYALDAQTGGELWRFDVDGGVTGMSLAGGVLYEATNSGRLYAISGDGSELTPGPIPSWPVVATPEPSSATAAPSTGAAASPAVSAELLWEATTPDQLLVPTTMALGPDGNLWVTDPLNDRFSIFTPDGAFVETWGSSGDGDGEFEFQRFNGDWYGGVAFAPDGSFFTLDAGNRRVQHFNKDRKFIGKWGSFGTKPGQFQLPTAIALSPDGTVHVLDEGRGVIERYDADGSVLGSVDPFQGHPSGFNTAGAMSIGDDGSTYVTMFGPDQIVRLDPGGTITHVYDSESFPDGPGYPFADATGRLFASQGPVRSGAPAVLVFDPAGRYLGGWGSVGSQPGDLSFPTGIVVDDEGDVYVGDAAGSPEFPGKHRIQKFHVEVAR
jgi:outer membrane protein assembly factor BamB